MDAKILQTLIGQAKARTDAAQARHANLLRAAGQARSHLELLQQYAREYDDRSRYRAGESRDPSASGNQRAFGSRLQVAVDTQVREVDLRERAAGTAGAEVADCLRKLKSLETLAQREQSRQARVQARRDQKNTDEFAQRAGQAGSAAGASGAWQARREGNDLERH